MKLHCASLLMFALLISSIAYSKEQELNTQVIKIEIMRQATPGSCLIGYLLVNSEHVAHTLERAPIGNLPTISSIPAGKYSAHLRYDKNDKWRIELEGVPDRTAIQIHIGNYPEQTEGCVLIGTSVNIESCQALNSGKAYANLKKAFTAANLGWEKQILDIVVVVSDSSN